MEYVSILLWLEKEAEYLVATFTQSEQVLIIIIFYVVFFWYEATMHVEIVVI